MSYRLFILSLWLEAEGAPHGRSQRRWALEDPQTGERTGFADLAALVRFLEDGSSPNPADPPTSATDDVSA